MTKDKYIEINEWIEEEIPKLKKKYNIHTGRRARSQAEKVTYLICESFLRYISSSFSTNTIQQANYIMEKHLYKRAYEEGLRVKEPIQNASINAISKENAPDDTVEEVEKIIEILVTD